MLADTVLTFSISPLPLDVSFQMSADFLHLWALCQKNSPQIFDKWYFSRDIEGSIKEASFLGLIPSYFHLKGSRVSKKPFNNCCYEFLPGELFSSDFWYSDRQTDKQKVMHKSRTCITTGGLTNGCLVPLSSFLNSCICNVPSLAFLRIHVFLRSSIFSPFFPMCCAWLVTAFHRA